MTASTPTPNEQTFNGWTNWATWCASLWALNDESNYATWRSTARRYRDDPEGAEAFLTENARHLFTAPDMEPGDWNDVNYAELAAALMEENE